MDHRVELNDPDHPDAKAAAEATARLLVDVHDKRMTQVTKPCGEENSARSGEDSFCSEDDAMRG